MKKILKAAVTEVLAWQVKRLRQKNSFKTIGVVGSIGKTSTKLAIAEVLGSSEPTQYQQGNYNDLTSVPLVYFGHDMPSLFNPLAWLRLWWSNERIISRPYPYKYVVLELGTDGPGQIAAFKKYVHLDFAVVTAITPEHMEFFADLDAVAKEELSVVQYAETTLVNSDLVNAEYYQALPHPVTYGLGKADHVLAINKQTPTGTEFSIDTTTYTVAGFSNAHVYSAAAAAIVAARVGFTADQIQSGLKAITPVSGRLQLLKGLKNSVIIDDTYNASPQAVKASLEVLYAIDAPNRLALLGNMNELGAVSEAEHRAIGALCNPAKVSAVLTLGPHANEYLASEAEAKGCKVFRCNTPYEAGEKLKELLTDNCVVLAKGSQNKVYAEEAVKLILANPEDASKLVRQSSDWLAKKQRNFSS